MNNTQNNLITQPNFYCAHQMSAISGLQNQLELCRKIRRKITLHICIDRDHVKIRLPTCRLNVTGLLSKNVLCLRIENFSSIQPYHIKPTRGCILYLKGSLKKLWIKPDQTRDMTTNVTCQTIYRMGLRATEKL